MVDNSSRMPFSPYEMLTSYGQYPYPFFWSYPYPGYPIGPVPRSPMELAMETSIQRAPLPLLKTEISGACEITNKGRKVTNAPDLVEIKEIRNKVMKVLTQKKLMNQNPKRNIITNIGNQLITFVSSRRKSESTLKRLFPSLTPEEVSNYYNFAVRIKQESEYYLNLEKIRKIWYCRHDTPNNSCQRKLMRQLSYHHLNFILPVSILSSRKMKSDSKMLHLKAKRVLVQQLRCPNQRFTFI